MGSEKDCKCGTICKDHSHFHKKKMALLMGGSLFLGVLIGWMVTRK